MARNCAVSLALLAALSASTGTTRSAGLSVAAQATVFLAHALPQGLSEKYYDASGAATHILLVVDSLLHSKRTTRQVLSAVASVMWATRLGSYLYARMLRDGVDHRFDSMKKAGVVAFAQAWAMQALWCFIVQLPLLVANSNEKEDKDTTSTRDVLGWAVFLTGFVVELVADAQKSAHRTRPENNGKFIDEGLWHYSRHPNMAGEILIWTGLAASCSSSFTKPTDWLGLLSPVFTYFLLTRVSGVPMLEKSSMKKWGNDAAYVAYVKNTPVLFPLLSSS